MSLTWPVKDPDEVLDYDIDWTLRLYSPTELAAARAQEDAGETVTVVPVDTITGSIWTIAGSVVKQSDSRSSTATKIWLTGGTIGEACALTNEITTSGGRKMDQTVKLKIKSK